MSTGPTATPGKWPVKRTIFVSVLLVLALAGIYFYNNYNRLLSEALMKSFNSSVISDVYELRFEDLRVNLVEGNIRVFNVSVLPRENPLNDYSYINSSFSLRTENILLESVEIRTLLKQNRLILKKIQITRPEIEFNLNGKRHIMLPFKDSTATSAEHKENAKRPIESFSLTEFQLTDATFHSKNSNKEREFKINDLNISVLDLSLDQQPSEYVAAFNRVRLTIGKFMGSLKKGDISHVGFTDFSIGIDSLDLRLTLDTLTYQFNDFTTGLKDLAIQTADSTNRISMKSFDLSYAENSIKLQDVNFKPNVSHAVLQRKHRYQNTEFSGSVGAVNLNNVNFDSLVYAEKLFIDEIVLEDVKASIYKDKTKPLDSTRFPAFPGQSIRDIKLPLLIKKVTATKINLENTEQMTDSTRATVKINRAKLVAENITNLDQKGKLVTRADGYLSDNAHFKVALTFLYGKPQFSFEGIVEKFDLPDLNPVIQAYTPAWIKRGVSDEISFSGIAERTKASGTMKFLYHDLEVDLKLHQKAKWKSSVIAFAANTVVNSSNPGSPSVPPRVVQFQVDRDMNKAFVNVVIKSVLNGVKETMIMSKENRKTYQDAKKESRRENKK